MGRWRRSGLGRGALRDDRGPPPRLTLAARLLIEYDGTDFAGWATQPGKRTVQETVETALATIAREPVKLTVAGRTDAGVHARGQVASHPGRPIPAKRISGLLPPDVAVLRSEEAPDDFDARRDARSRTYRYRVLTRALRSPLERRTALHWRGPLDREALHACAAVVLGTHDFTAFTPAGGYHQRFTRDVMRSEWVDHGEVLEYWIEADSFMRHMVRTLVGTILAEPDPGVLGELLSGRPRTEAGDTAAAWGLCLEAVSYD
jgi:tRNA pseudouridine38-40 synthase